MNLYDEANVWEDTEKWAKQIVDNFTLRVNIDSELKPHRDFIERHGYGCGERAFHWMWKLIVDEVPENFRFLEVGVYMGQVLSLIRLLSAKADIVGVTLLNRFSGVTGKFPEYPDDDYMQCILDLHNRFEQPMPTLYVGDSTSKEMHEKMLKEEPFDIVYIDGCHEYDYVLSDLMFYPTLLKKGGFLVVDDSACALKQPEGYFQGIHDVSLAVRAIIETNSQWEHLIAVMHNRIWRKT